MDFSISWPAAAADPPVAMRSLQSASASRERSDREPPQRRGGERREGRGGYPLDDDTLLTRQNGPLLHLEPIRPILLFILYDLALSRQLAPLPNRDKRGAEPHSQYGAKEESARVEPHDDVNLGGWVRGEDVVRQMGDECFEGEWVAQEGEDVEERYALRYESASVGSDEHDPCHWSPHKEADGHCFVSI